MYSVLKWISVTMLFFTIGFATGDMLTHGKAKSFLAHSETKYVLMPHAQMVFDKNTPWNSFTIQEKMFLCAFGSSGNKLDKKEMAEIQELYGIK